jgi:myosin heavy subunit
MIIHHDLENILKSIIHSNHFLVCRFYKNLFLWFRKSITGAKLSEFLLEKSRIVTHSNDERNYHVFYELLEGFDAEEKRKYGLTTPEKYFYLNQVILK